MKMKVLIALMVLIPLVFGSVVYAENLTPLDLEAPNKEESTVYEYHVGDVGDQLSPASAVDDSYMGIAGLNWFPEKTGKFSKIKRKTNGTITRVNTPGMYFVNISVPIQYQDDGFIMKIRTVGFCGKSSNGAKTKPIKWKLFSDGNQFFSSGLSWDANENRQCRSTVFTAPIWKLNLIVSVFVNYHNTSHTFTFDKVYVHTVP